MKLIDFLGISSFIDALALIVAICAFGATFWQARSSKKHNKLSVQPLIVDENQIEWIERKFNYNLVNKGLGTAKVKSFQFYWDEKSVSEKELRRNIEVMTRQGDTVEITNLGENYALSKDEVVEVVTIQIKGTELSDKPDERFDKILKQLITYARVSIQYESLYNDSFEFNTSTSAMNLDDYSPES